MFLFFYIIYFTLDLPENSEHDSEGHVLNMGLDTDRLLASV